MAFFRSLRGAQSKDLLPAPMLNDRVVPYPVPPGQVGKPYRSDWDIQRAVEFGLQQNIWVYRCVNSIANAAARLPMVMRNGNPIDGAQVDHPMLDLFNFQSSSYESALVFRKRLSQVLLLNKQGVMVEVVRNRMGGVAALYILPPGFTWPIPNELTFVSAFRVQFPGKGWYDVPAENVIWIREPHPVDPYSGQTPLEAAGLSIETDYYMRLYRRNFLMNDGRPGGLLIIQGQIDETAAAQLRQRFYGATGYGPTGAGRTTVMEADGAQYVDTSQSPRDAQYAEGSTITRDEILQAFGVPQSIIGQAAERTFANASEEGLMFWEQTMLTHLDTIARALDALDPNPRLYLGYDLSRVRALQIPVQQERQFMLSEAQAGGISWDEYRLETGRKPVGGGAAKLRVAANLVEIADTTAALQPDTGADHNARASLVETQFAGAIEAKSREAHSGIIVAVMPPPEVAHRLAGLVPDGVDPDDVHVTLAYLGDKDDWNPLDLADLERVIREFCQEEAPVIAEITGTGRFTVGPGSGGKVPEIALVSSAPLLALRARLMDRLASEGLAQPKQAAA